MAKEVELGDQIIRILLFLTLFLYKPVQELHGSEILLRIGSIIDGVNQDLQIRPEQPQAYR